MRSMQQELATKLDQVGERIQKGDNRNVILRSRSGKTQWRLPSSGAKSLLNNPFFEQLNQVNDAISNAIAKLEIFQHYNIQEGVLHASADGQEFESRLHTFKTRYSSKYFGTSKGVSAVTLVANHVPVNARVIGANEHESHYIFDLLFNNTSEIKPDILSTDTHGVNHVNFALLDLFDYAFAPRYAQFGRVIEGSTSVMTISPCCP